MVTLVKRKFWKAKMDLGLDPREGLIYLFAVDCYQVVGMCFYSIIVYNTLHSHRKLLSYGLLLSSSLQAVFPAALDPISDSAPTQQLSQQPVIYLQKCGEDRHEAFLPHCKVRRAFSG